MKSTLGAAGSSCEEGRKGAEGTERSWRDFMVAENPTEVMHFPGILMGFLLLNTWGFLWLTWWGVLGKPQ